jgi:TolB protein
MNRLKLILCGLLLLCAGPAAAQVKIEVIGGDLNQIPIAIPPFAGEEALKPSMSDIIEADLTRSGRFKAVYIPGDATGLSDQSSPDYAAWKTRNAQALVLGSVTQSSGQSQLRYHLYDVSRQTWLEGKQLPHVGPSLVRNAAHRAADYIYEKLTGERGAFNTRIVFVVKSGRDFTLQIADADGEGRETLHSSSEPIISPALSPDGNAVAYVSFENKKPVVYVYNLQNRGRRAVANFTGSNSAPAWSPDGRQLAVALSKDGGTQLYMVNADGSGVRRLASSPAIDTEPVFSPDGQSLYFTSDRGGGPQIYRMPASGGSAQRVTVSGTYNVSPDISPDGKLLAYITRGTGGFQVATLDLTTNETTILSDTSHDESPSFAPNGKMILYATSTGGRGVLAVTSIDGRSRYRLSIPAGDVREPNWGPFQQ